MKVGGRRVIVGFGLTGQSVAQHFVQQSVPFVVTEDILDESRVAEFKAQLPSHASSEIEFLPISELQFDASDLLMVSPGVPVKHPKIQAAINVGAAVSNDVQLFTELCEKPLALITGSNGKSTVTHYVDQLLAYCGINAAIGGNIGIPALNILDGEIAAYVLEVSSYQLELAANAKAKVGALLNLSPDHLDRYDSLQSYYETKMNVFNSVEIAVFCRETSMAPKLEGSQTSVSFGLDAPAEGHYGIETQNNESFICFGAQKLVNVDDLPVSGRHHLMNVMAALAISRAMGADLNDLLDGLKTLVGLPHRFEVLADIAKHHVINDSKSTNPGSTLAAIESLSDSQLPIDLLLGGLAKDADFSVLLPSITKHVSRCFVYGADRGLLIQQLQKELSSALPSVELIEAETLDDCLNIIAQAEPRVILFSPACASQDQFRNFEARGDYFKSRVRERLL